MGKVRISATIDKETDILLDTLVKKQRFRNKSHAIEEAIRLLEENNDKK